MFSSTFLKLASLLAFLGSSQVLGAPAVEARSTITAVALPAGCASYPVYNNSTGVAGPWLLQLVNSGNTTMEGFSNTAEYSLGSTGIRWGYITFPTENDIAKTPLQCVAGSLQAYVATGVSGYTWQNLQFGPYPYDATIIYEVQGTPISTFSISIDSVPQDGVFLGSNVDGTAYTTFGLQYEPQGADGLQYFYTRLLGPNSNDPFTGQPLFPGEFTAQIRVLADL